MRRPGRRSALLPGLGEADQERSSLAARTAEAAADPERSFRATVIRGDMSRLSRSWNGSLVPRLQFVITAGAANASLTCRYARAAYRNRTDDLRITRVLLSRSVRASCTDGTENRTDGTRRTGTIHGPVPRSRPLRHAFLFTIRGKARQLGMTLRHEPPAAG